MASSPGHGPGGAEQAARECEAGAGGPPAKPDVTAVGRGCSRALLVSRTHLQLCLKLLSVLSRAGENSRLPPDDEEHQHASPSWLATVGGDDLYLAMVMLNSSILKALHVVDSFHQHCCREFPLGLSLDEDEAAAVEDECAPVPFLDQLGCEDDPLFSDPADAALGAAGGTCDKGGTGARLRGGCAPGVGGDEAAGTGVDVRASAVGSATGTVASREYRQLQAQCDVQEETVRSAEEQLRADAARLGRLEDEVRQLRESLDRQTRCASGGDKPGAAEARVCVEEDVDFHGQSLVVRRAEEDGVGCRFYLSDGEMQQVTGHAQRLRRESRQLASDRLSFMATADESRERSSEANLEEEQLCRLLGCTASSELHAALIELTAEADASADATLPTGGEGGASPPLSGQATDASPAATPPSVPSSGAAGPPASAPSAPTAQVPALRPPQAAGSCTADGGAALPHPPHGQSPALCSGARQLQQAANSALAAAGALGGVGHFGECCAAPALRGQVSAPGVAFRGAAAAKRRAAYGALQEERQITRAALRYVKSRDSQALGRLVSLMGGGVPEAALPAAPEADAPAALAPASGSPRLEVGAHAAHVAAGAAQCKAGAGRW